MDKLSIGKFNFGVIKQLSGTKKQETTQNATSAAQSNPFGINFKGNVYAADVFESSKAKSTSNNDNLLNKASEKAKMSSALQLLAGFVTKLLSNDGRLFRL